MSFIDDEIENYQAKYGCIDSNDVHFDDHPEFGFDYLDYKITKIKIWSAKKTQYTVLGGIQTTYINNKAGTEFISPEHKGEKVDNDSFVEFILKKNEYIVNSSLWFEEGSICKIIFKTNLKNTFSVGDAKGDELEVSEFGKNKFILSFFGTYSDKYLTSIGMFINKQDEFFNYFLRGYLELKIFLSKDKNYNEIKEKEKNKVYNEIDLILIKACKLPKNVFNEIIKYIIPF